MQKRFRIYIDESGDHTYNDLDNPAKRYLCLTGCFLEVSEVPKLQEDLTLIKRKHFKFDPDESLIFHRSKIINRQGPFYVLQDSQKEEVFNNDLLGFLSVSNYRIIAVVIDKKTHSERYGDFAYHPYHYCLAAILERYCGYLNFHRAVGDVLAESRGGQEDQQLKEAYRRIYRSGTNMRGPEFFQSALTTGEIKLKLKAVDIAGLQLADMLAYPVRQEILIEKWIIPDPGDNFGRKIIRQIQPKFNCHLYTGRIPGYGKIFIP